MSTRSLLFSVHSWLPDWQNTKLSSSGRKRTDTLLQICVCPDSLLFHMWQPHSLEPILSLTYTQHCLCHSQYQLLARDLGMKRHVSAFSQWLQEACKWRQVWFRGITLCGCCLFALLVTLPNQIIPIDVTDIITKYCHVVHNSIVLACAEFSLKPIVVGYMNWIFPRIWEMLFVSQ